MIIRSFQQQIYMKGILFESWHTSSIDICEITRTIGTINAFCINIYQLYTVNRVSYNDYQVKEAWVVWARKKSQWSRHNCLASIGEVRSVILYITFLMILQSAVKVFHMKTLAEFIDDWELWKFIVPNVENTRQTGKN